MPDPIDGTLYNGASFHTLVEKCYHKPNRDSWGCPDFLKNLELNCWDVSESKSLFYGRYFRCNLL